MAVPTWTEHALTAGTPYWNDCYASAIVDIDNDGDKDIVCGSWGADLWLYRNNGSQSFTISEMESSYQGAIAEIRVGDMDADGDQDVVAASYGSDNIYLYTNSNNGTTFTRSTVGTSDDALSVDIGNLDGDAALEVVTSGRNEDTVKWFDYTGGAWVSHTIDSLDVAYDAVIGDMDGDGDQDSVGVSATSALWWYQNDGAGSFTERTVPTTSGIYNISVGDVDGDGSRDIVATDSYRNIYWFKNSGTGSFTKYTATTYGTTTEPGETEVIDVDGDGDNDIMVIAYGGGVLWLENDGNETFTQRTIDSSHGNPNNLDVGDIDSDGDVDVIAGGYTSYVVSWWEQNGSSAPDLVSLSPADEAYNVSTTSDFVITFDEAVQSGTGTIVIKKASDNSIIETITANDTGLVSGSGTTTITINPATTLATDTAYYLTIGSNAFKDGSGQNYAGISATTTWNFTSQDTIAPTVSTLSPADNATGINQTANLVLTLSETVTVGTGTIVIKKTSDDSVIETIAANNATYVSGSNSTTITINPASTLTAFVEYYVTVHGNALQDLAGNDLAAWSDASTWNFTTADLTAPTVSTYSPADNATGINVNANLVLTFSEIIQGGTGTIVIKKGSDNSVVETITTNDTSLVSGSGTTTITINPASVLSASTAYYVLINKNAFQDAFGLDYAGYISTTTWNFTTSATDTVAPTVFSLSPADNATDVSTTANLVITFNEVTRAGTGTLTLKKTSDNSTVETITVSGALLSGNGTNQLTFNPSVTLADNTSYYVVWHANAFKDASSNKVAVQSSTTYWDFTTAGDTTAPSVSSLSPADDATDVSTTTNLVITFNEVTRAGTGTLSIKKSANSDVAETITVSGALLSGNGTTTLTFNPSATLAEYTGYYITWTANAFKDATGNHVAAQTSGSTWNFVTEDTTAPTITAIVATTTSSGATVTWTTNENTSSRLQYGLTRALGSITEETDTGAGVETHEVSLSGLPVCTTYFSRPVSSDPSGNTATGSLTQFTTTGCTASATVGTQTGSTVTAGGGSLDMTSNGSGAALTVPASATTNTFTLQIKKLDTDTVITSIATPSGVEVIGDHTYDIRAISGSTVVTSFLEAITVTMEYTDDQISGYDESTLWIYRWDGSTWNALDACAVNASANTVSCTTTHFSTFGLFGDAEDSGDSGNTSSNTATTQGSGGRRGSGQDMAVRIAAARSALLARFESKRQESVQIATGQSGSSTRAESTTSNEEQAAQQREARIAERIATHEAEIAQIEQTKKAFEEKYALHREERMARAVAQEEEKLAKAQIALLAEQEALKTEQEANTKRREERLAKRDSLDEQGTSKSAAPSLASVAARRDRLYAMVDETPVLYADVPLSAWYAPFVSFMVEEKIATGYADTAGKPTGEFGVTNPVTFAETLKMALNAAGKETGNLPPPRNASAQGTWAAGFVAQAEALSLSLFSPKLNVHSSATRGAVIQTILEVMGIPTAAKTPSSFKDVPHDHPYAPAIVVATTYGLVTGDLDSSGNPLGTFRPDDPITRAEVAKIIALVKEVMQ